MIEVEPQQVLTRDWMRDGFWSRRVTAFFDVRLTHVNYNTNQGNPTPAIFKELESENKPKYQKRVLKAEMSSFNPIIFGTNGGMSEECKIFMKQLRFWQRRTLKVR